MLAGGYSARPYEIRVGIRPLRDEKSRRTTDGRHILVLLGMPDVMGADINAENHVSVKPTFLAGIPTKPMKRLEDS